MNVLIAVLIALQGPTGPTLQYQAGTACGRVAAGWNAERTEAILITFPRDLRSLEGRALPVGGASGVSVRVVPLSRYDGFRRCGEDLGPGFVEVLSSLDGWLASAGSIRVSVSGRFPFGSARIDLRNAVFVNSSGQSTSRRLLRFTVPINDTIAG
jgi:hypothetical protein